MRKILQASRNANAMVAADCIARRLVLAVARNFTGGAMNEPKTASQHNAQLTGEVKFLRGEPKMTKGRFEETRLDIIGKDDAGEIGCEQIVRYLCIKCGNEVHIIGEKPVPNFCPGCGRRNANAS